MNRKTRTSWFAALILLALVDRSAATEFRDDSIGLSLDCPDGWTALSKFNLEAVRDKLPPELKRWIEKEKPDFSQVKVLVIRNDAADFLENLNVVVNENEMPVNDDSVHRLMDLLLKQYQRVGAGVMKIHGQVERIGDREAVVVEFDSRMPGVDFLLRQRQVAFPGGGNTYFVTSTAAADSFADHAPTFEGILRSMKTPAPGGFNWNRVLFMSAVGGAIGGLLGLLMKVFKKAGAPTAAAR